MPASHDLLQAICDLGAPMCDALSSDDLDAFFALMQKRTLLVGELKACEPSAAPDPGVRETAAALEAQHKVLAQAMAAQEQRINEALAALHRYEAARGSYADPASPASVLHRGIRG